jgi:hypothetical protein
MTSMKIRSFLISLLSVAFIATAFAQSPTPQGDAKPGQPASAAPESYGPLAFNVETAGDFYIAQDGQFVKAELVEGVIRFHLRNKPFQIGTNVEQANIALTLKKEDEIGVDGQGFKASHLAGPLTGARSVNSDELFVYGGESWSDGNSELSEGRTRSGVPLFAYKHAYDIRTLTFYHRDDLAFERFKGTLYGFICVYKDHVRKNSFIMPIELDFQ